MAINEKELARIRRSNTLHSILLPLVVTRV